jgi:ubiquinone/menaquinone biosynthesis C-methylase UbiE
MNKIEWLTDTYLTVGDYQIPCASDLTDGYNQGSGIKLNSKLKLMLKRAIWPFWKLHNDLLVDGFIEREIGKLIKKYMVKEAVLLDIGCGDMSLRRFVPSDLCYNALDLELSDFHIIRALQGKQNVNIVLASATNIPAASSTVSLIVSTEVFEHIPEIDKAIQEIYRIATPDATVICSIPNNYCYKYVKKGPHRGHINNWTYEGFIEIMKYHHFEFIEGVMKGKWVPFPLWITKTSYQLPLSSASEYHNTNFFYVFRVSK